MGVKVTFLRRGRRPAPQRRAAGDARARRPRVRPTAAQTASCSSSTATSSSVAPSQIGGTDGDRVEVLAGLGAAIGRRLAAGRDLADGAK